jgi:hypothetical protein
MNNNTLYIQPYHIIMMKEKQERKPTKKEIMKKVFIIKTTNSKGNKSKPS